ncbi:hypothetical protein [Nocardioides sp. URHA0032]|uniref:hypothetical protein n=1 Tax=Nocardioides sp. URHA0032 TaxID=1380388 RepID=UPI00068441BC|nr:hypothetical protein [Nocardioides sp. URHA0032]
MSLVNTETGELIEPMGADDARRLTERIRIAATNYTEAKAKVLQLVDEARAGAAHVALGYKSWTAYLSDVLSDEPLRLARDERRELVTHLADQGMSHRAIAPIVGIGNAQVSRDLAAVAPNGAVVRETEGLDGRVRTTVTAGRVRASTPGTTERAHQEAELINAFGSIVKRSLTPENVATLSPRAKGRLIEILTVALTTLKENDQ